MKDNDFEKELHVIREKLAKEEEGLTFAEIKEKEQKMFDDLEKEYGFDFRTLAKKTSYYDLKKDLSYGMVAEDTPKYGKENE